MNKENLPQHVAFIIDGNRRWAVKNGLPKFEGHRRGLARTREMIEECLNLGIGHCTIWGFSTENWKRGQAEVNYLMALFEEYLKEHVQALHEKKVRIIHLGRKDRIPSSVVKLLEWAENLTKQNSGLILNLAIDYGGRDEIIRAITGGIDRGITSFPPEIFSDLLDTKNSPDPDLIIRTSGEKRLSGFLPWQSAYSELYFTDICFPDFTVEEFHKALEDYARRKRNIGT